ncbi:MAG TPA: hypothetical protein VFR28_06705 [Allosphingosinicella sp.]|nr:hypothetical protein [Allosphingosinicella sp.]
MKNANRARIAMAVSAALGLAALSSSASAQTYPIDPQECETRAWELCYYEGAPGGVWSFRCWHDTYNACLAGEYSSAVKAPGEMDRRPEIQLA